jgi:hypothetical protein
MTGHSELSTGERHNFRFADHSPTIPGPAAYRWNPNCYMYDLLVLSIATRDDDRSPTRPRTLPDGVDQFPYSREMMIVVFRDKIQVVYESHRGLQTRVRNGSRK